MFKTKFSGHNKILAYGCAGEGSPDGHSFTKGLSKTTNECIHIVNFGEGEICSFWKNSWILNIQLLCEEMVSERCFTSVRWVHGAKLSQNSSSSCLKYFSSYKVRTITICINTLKMIVVLLNVHIWPTYLNTLNELNIKMQGKNENILTCSDKLKGCKLNVVL